jgi:NAD(P)H-dependent flavin oxidoreductase YrpB (nitropropane dioxygenase family)
MTESLHPTLRTPACELFGVRYPIVQTGMGYVSGPELTAATANAGGLGILGGGSMTYDELVAAVSAVKDRTGAPFGVNMRANQPDINRRIDLVIREGVKVASFALAPGVTANRWEWVRTAGGWWVSSRTNRPLDGNEEARALLRSTFATSTFDAESNADDGA